MTLQWEQDPNALHCTVALLNGWWEFAPLFDEKQFKTPPAEYPERILVPSFWNTLPPDLGGTWGAYRNFEWPGTWNQARAAAHRRSFPLPERPPDQRLRLRFDAVLAQADVFLNGQRVLTIEDGFLPHEADVTDAARWDGENVLEVLVREHPKIEGGYARPAGSWVGWNLRGIWQDCSLRLEPATRLADVFVKTSVRRDLLEIETRLDNARDTDLEVLVEHRVVAETIALEASANLAPKTAAARVVARIAWESPELWAPETPRLYWLESTLKRRADGAVLDTRRTRFGFREFWIDGTGFVLNGKPIRLKGDSWHYMGAVQQTPDYVRHWYTMVKSIGANSVRLHAQPHPPYYVEIADEMGILLINESAVYGSGGNLALEHEEFWDHARQHVQRMALRDRNHPSVVLWSACNEVVWKGGEDSYAPLLSLETAIREVDPTRPVSFDENNSDLGGGASIYGGHYGSPADWNLHWKRDKPLMVNEFGCLYYSGPEEPAFWGGEVCYADFDARTRAGGVEGREMIVALRALGAASITPWNFAWYGLHPAFPPEPVALDPDPASPGIHTQRIGAHSVSINYDLEDGRRLDPGFPGRWKPNAAFDTMREGYAAIAAFVRERDNNVFDNTTLVRHVDVYNDVSERNALVLEWRLGDLASGALPLNLGVYEHRLERIDVPIPKLETATATVPFTVTLRRAPTDDGEDGGAILHSTETEYWIAARAEEIETGRPAATQADRREVFLLDSTAETLIALESMGVPFRYIDEIELLDPILTEALRQPERGVTLVVGSDQRKDVTLHDFVRHLQELEFFARGGVLVALEGAFAPDLDSPLAPIERPALRAWRRSHPAFWRDIPDDDALRFWGQDGTLPWLNGPVARAFYRKPARGAFVPLAEVNDCSETPLLWLPLERGGVFVNGFELVANAQRHPAAATILARLVETAPADLASSDRALPVRINAPAHSNLSALAERMRFAAAPEDEPDTNTLLLLDASNAAHVETLDAAALRRTLERGGRVVLMNVVPETLDFARAVSGLDLALESGPWQNVAKTKGRELDPALQGLSHEDLLWVRRGQSETVCEYAYVEIPALDSLVSTVDVQWAGYAEAAEQYKYALMLRRRAAFPGPRVVVGAVRVGEGRLLLSQLNLAEARVFTTKAWRVTTLLTANAGARFGEDVSPLLRRRSPFVDENGFIRRWLLLGVFTDANPNALLAPDYVGGEADLQPREDEERAGKRWFVHTATQPDVDLRQAFHGHPVEDVAAYMGLYVHSPRSRDIILDTPDMVDLALGSDDGVRAWLNGELLIDLETVRPWQADQNRIRGVKLREGWNRLVLKISQRGGGWQASARFLTTSGLPVADLTYALAPPETP